jgi:hypothetical protein
MKNTQRLVWACAAVALAGCNNGQPRIYRVALGALGAVAPQCYKSGNLPQLTTDNRGFVTQFEATIWDGAEKQYLDIGSQTFSLGDSPKIVVQDVMESSADKVFTGTRTRIQNVGNSIEQRSTNVVVKWNDYGFAPNGTMELKSEFGCNGGGCPAVNPAPDAVSCTATLTFAARRVEAQQVTAYPNNP